MNNRNRRRIMSGMTYCPKNLIQEMEEIKQEQGLSSKSEAFNKVADFSKIGRLASHSDAIDYDKIKAFFPARVFPKRIKRNGGY